METALDKTVLRGGGAGSFAWDVREWKWTEAENKRLPLKGNLVRCLRSLTSENDNRHISGNVMFYLKYYTMHTVYKHSIT
jgi:hypothetical protein